MPENSNTEENPEGNHSYREFDLSKARKCSSNITPAAHQGVALSKLDAWFQKKTHEPHAGGIMVLPTGGGKTFTAVRFLCRGPLSSGYKLLWLAHTHHLLEQAYDTFAPRDDAKARKSGYEVGQISEPKDSLSIRVVSGTPGHSPVHSIKPIDDVVIVTLQTLSKAYKVEHPSLTAFLKAAGEKLFVVFDEAHHSPAPSYRVLITQLQKAQSQIYVLGLTATPTYEEEQKKGWMKKLFPQGILYQVSTQKLIAEGILANPMSEKCTTDVTPDFDEREYQKWIGTYRDLPDKIINNLAKNQERNALIAKAYVQKKEHYGKTIIFAERWYQCEQLREFLLKHNVRAGAVYSHIDAVEATVAGRNKRDKDENALELKKFKENELDVLINVRMLTEGTDVPDIQTVFLTRQTTSNILLTQMVGRALRGPKFGGTENAYIVSFIDNWRQAINWAEYDQLAEGQADDGAAEYPKRPPLQLISIELVRRLARQMDSGLNVAPEFLTLMPIGWYRTSFVSSIEGSDDEETVSDLVMVFEDDKECYQKFIEHLSKQNLQDFAGEGLVLDNAKPHISAWAAQFFSSAEKRNDDELLKNLLDITRHMAQNDNEAPTFFAFKEREHHDLDVIAKKFYEEDLGPREANESLLSEYHRKDRYWTTIYSSYTQFKSQYDSCINRILGLDAMPVPDEGTIIKTEGKYGPEPSDEVKEQVKKRDGYRCLCCGEDNKRFLQIDHVAPSYYGVNNSLANLQTLCKLCNNLKGNKIGINTFNFQINKNQSLSSAPDAFHDFPMPNEKTAKEARYWELFLRRSLNFFYQCSAVSSVVIGGKGKNFYEWRISLYEGNDPQWLKPYLNTLFEKIQSIICETRKDNCVVKKIIISAPDQEDVASS